jgi:hypothetical protein
VAIITAWYWARLVMYCMEMMFFFFKKLY